jgi:hypothetical protein
VLGQKEGDLLGYLQQQGNPFWARRSLQLLACLRLEAKNGAERWKALLLAAEGAAEARSRWVDAVLTAPFRSARLQNLMPEVGEVLLESGGPRLLHFLRALRTQAIKPNRALEKRLRETYQSSPRVETLLLELGEPEEAQWTPVLSWIVPRLLDLPELCREEASKVMAIWERTTRAGGLFRREIAEAALAWRSSLLPVERRRPYAMRAAEPYFNRLRDIAVASADAISEGIPELFAHLRATESDDNLKRWIAEGPIKNLIQRAPAPYAEFTLDVLVPEWRQKRIRKTSPDHKPRFSFNLHDERDPEWRMLKNDYAFSPPSQQRGPFLAVLEADESAGLHLISTLIDRATASRFRENKLQGYSRLGPDYIILSLQTGNRRFLGDRLVYAWSSPTSEGPRSVQCALAALELWTKQQIKTGRNPEELFSTVLASSRSIATVAVCVATFFAFPARCLRAAAPFVSNSLLCNYDRDIRSYIGAYALSPDPEIRELVIPRVRKFRDKLFAAHAHPSNYHRSDDGTIYFVPPENLVKPHRQFLQHWAVKTRHIELLNWVHEVAKKVPNLEGFTIAQAMERAQELLQPGEFDSPISRDHQNYERQERLRAIVGSVTAVLRLNPHQVGELGQLPWCEEVLIAAAKTPCDEEAGWRRVSSDDFVLAAAQGLLLLLEQGRSSERARQASFALLQRPENEIIDFVFGRIPSLWDLEPVFCRNAVARELALSLEPWKEQEEPRDKFDSGTPRADAKVREVKERYARNILENRLPASIGFGPLTPREWVETQYVERALGSLPLERLTPEGDLLWIKATTEQVLTWTFGQLALQSHDQPSSGWLTFFGEWLARFSRLLSPSEAERMILLPIREGWPGTARLMENVLAGWTWYRLHTHDQLSEESNLFWRALAQTILTAADQPRSPLRERILELLLHVRNGRILLDEHWHGAPEFIDVYDLWVEGNAQTAWGFSRLLLFLNAAGKNLPAARALRWLSNTATRSKDRDELWREHENLFRTAELLAGLWERGTAQTVYAEYTSLLDELVRAGSPLAENLRKKASSPLSH